jgi:hypothetical protein
MPNYFKFEVTYKIDPAPISLLSNKMNSGQQVYYDRIKSKIEAEHKGASIDEGEMYSTAKVRMKVRCEEDHPFLLDPSRFINNNSWCTICKRHQVDLARIEKLNADVRKKIAGDHPGAYLHEGEKCTTRHTTVRTRCERGHDFDLTPGQFLNDRLWCRYCTFEDKALKCDHYGKVIEKMKEFHPEARLHEGETCKHRKDTMMATCENNHNFILYVDHFLSRNSFCPDCAGNGGLTFKADQQARIVAKINKEHKGAYLKEGQEYINQSTKLETVCEKGHDFLLSPPMFLCRSDWCDTCCQSKGELALSRILDKLGYKGSIQYTIPGTRYRFDWVSEDKSKVVEFDGKPHFEPVDFWQGEAGLQLYHNTDTFKTQWSIDNNIRILRIDYRYLDTPHMEDIIVEFFNNQSIVFLFSSANLYQYLTPNLQIPHTIQIQEG